MSKRRLSTTRHEDYTVGWVCALREEHVAAQAMLDEEHPELSKPSSDNNAYTLGSIGQHNVVLARLPKGQYGAVSATAVVTQMASTYPSLKFAFLVGIGGGVPSNKVRLGDVVVSTPGPTHPGVVQWTLGEGGCGFKQLGVLNNPPNFLLAALTNLETRHEISGSKVCQFLEEVATKYPNLAAQCNKNNLKDVLYRSSYTHVDKQPRNGGESSNGDTEDDEEADDEDDEQEPCRWCDGTKIRQRKPRPMKVHYGLVASGDIAIESALSRDNLNEALGGKVICIETEAAGLLKSFPGIIIRGISDYTDSHKSNRWYQHAALVAAAFAKEITEYIQPEAVLTERSIRELVEIRNAISRTEAKVEKIESIVDNNNTAKIIHWLSSNNYGYRQTYNLGLQESGTGQWLLESPKFKRWQNSENGGQTLFCRGIPGSGKSVMTAIVIEHLQNFYKGDETIGIAYIYFDFKMQNEQQPINLLTSLIRQLVQRRRRLPECVNKLYESHAKAGTRPSIDETMVTLLQVTATYSRVFFLIDALDECHASNRANCARFLSDIIDLQRTSEANLFATSRPVPEIAEYFEYKPAMEIRASESDLQIYIRKHPSYISGIIRDDKTLQEEVENVVIEQVRGMFLLAKLSLDALDGMASTKEVLTALKRKKEKIASTDGGVDDAYYTIYGETMARINHQVGHARNRAFNVFSWITFSRTPLSPKQLQRALAVEFDTNELDERNLPRSDLMIGGCAGLVTIDPKENVVRFVHHTIQEYFELTKATWFPQAQSYIAKTCVTYLSYDDVKNYVRDAMYDYAANNWGHHVLLSHMETEETVLAFFKNQRAVSGCSVFLWAQESYRDPFGRHRNEFNEGQASAMSLAAYHGLAKSIDWMLSNGVGTISNSDPNQSPMGRAIEMERETVVDLFIERKVLAERDYSDALILAVQRAKLTIAKKLLDHGARTDGKDASGKTPIDWAVEIRDELMIRLLLDHGANVNTVDTDGRSLLLRTLMIRSEGLAKLLLERGADPNIIDRLGNSPLRFAIENYCGKISEELVDQGADVNISNQIGRTSLFCALRCYNEQLASKLMDRGADIHPRDSRGQTPLFIAVENWFHKTTMQLIERGADINHKDNEGQTPLFTAIEKAGEKAMKLLIDNGADIHGTDKFGQTPLLVAVKIGNIVGAELLVDRGANVEAVDFNGKSSLALANQSAELEDGRDLKEEMFRILFSRGASFANVNIRDIDFSKFLTASVKRRRGGAVASRLINLGADISIRDSQNRTLLGWAARSGNENLVKALLARGADKNARDSLDMTPLMLAARYGRSEIVKLLLDEGVDVEMTTLSGVAG
ncbi:hypothetical protein H072_4397 [Dactylellina haptotyla CBS 200.50]|uniref:NACHT domain-containing protein n=1 Tax=Dactylellina haptotyla (strain CBS 200.50) TaxID=1284197 RepID=S8AF75_DACHA|nr:hypothetical protein H072_4397 [Dactylellina haptotyla CBS 200.50]